MKAGPNPPGPEGMEQHRIRPAGFVGVVLVPQLVSFVLRIEELRQLRAELFDLLIRQDPIQPVLDESNLLVSQAMLFPIGLGRRSWSKSPTRSWRREVGRQAVL